MGENIRKSYVYKGLMQKYFKNTCNSNIYIKNLNGQKICIDISPKRIYTND